MPLAICSVLFEEKSSCVFNMIWNFIQPYLAKYLYFFFLNNCLKAIFPWRRALLYLMQLAYWLGVFLVCCLFLFLFGYSVLVACLLILLGSEKLLWRKKQSLMMSFPSFSSPLLDWLVLEKMLSPLMFRLKRSSYCSTAVSALALGTGQSSS